MIIRTVFRAVGWLVSELMPMQAIRTIRGCDYTQAVTRAEAVLADLEEEREVWEPLHPGEFLCQHGARCYATSETGDEPWTWWHCEDDDYPCAAPPLGGGILVERSRTAASSTDSAAQAAESPAGVDDPPGVPPAGHHQHPK